jgi:hypothetical protein
MKSLHKKVSKPRQPVLEELEKQYDVVQVDASAPITDSYDVLLAVQPSSLGPEQMNHFVAAVRAGQPVGPLGNLPGKFEDDPVLLLHVTLEKSQTFFEVVKPGIHAAEDGSVAGRGKPMPALYDNYDCRRTLPGFGGCQPVD